jgi:hypothetical protein
MWLMSTPEAILFTATIAVMLAIAMLVAGAG